MKPLSERMLKEYLRHDAQYDGGLDVPAPPLERWAAEVAALEARIEALEKQLDASLAFPLGGPLGKHVPDEGFDRNGHINDYGRGFHHGYMRAINDARVRAATLAQEKPT